MFENMSQWERPTHNSGDEIDLNKVWWTKIGCDIFLFRLSVKQKRKKNDKETSADEMSVCDTLNEIF